MSIKRKFRYSFEAIFPNGKIEPIWLHAAYRPQLQIEEIKQPDGTKVIGKCTWLPLTMSFYSDEIQDMEFYDAIRPFIEDFGSDKSAHDSLLGKGILRFVDDESNTLWHLEGLWPTAVNWGDLDFSNSDSLQIEVTWRFSKCYYELVDQTNFWLKKHYEENSLLDDKLSERLEAVLEFIDAKRSH